MNKPLPLCQAAATSISKLQCRTVVIIDCGFFFANAQLFSHFA